MKRQVIETFLNLSGVAGMALMDDGRSRPYFYGIDTVLNSQQLEALAKGIQQVVSTTPHDFESFTFHFAHHDTHIYRLTNGTILLVLTNPNLDKESYGQHLPQLRQVLQDDAQNAIANFRLLAGSSTLTGPNYWKPATQAVPAYPTKPSSPKGVNWETMLSALNCLSDATAHYLGKIVVANTWRSTRPNDDGLTALNLDRDGHFALKDPPPSMTDTLVDDETQSFLQLWVEAFSTRCARIIRDYRKMVIEQELTEPQRAALKISAPK
jgi:hypothetical protein